MEFLELTVSELSDIVQQILEDTMPFVRVTGEVIGFKENYNSGHWYFNLSDGKSTVNAVCFANVASKIAHMPSEGEKITISGKMTTYKRSSNYQIVVSSLEKLGIGKIVKQLEELKQKLLQEGLFEEKWKKALPFMPNIVGLITSSTGAVIEDMRVMLEGKVLSKAMLYPALTQGVMAPRSIIAGLKFFNSLKAISRPEVIIVARGGGSFEDLFCFNDEELVRAIFASEIPVISAVGHETDYTLCDFVSDVRAPTPTAGAKMVSPEREDILKTLQLSRRKLAGFVLQHVNDRRYALGAIKMKFENFILNIYKSYINRIRTIKLKFVLGCELKIKDFENLLKQSRGNFVLVGREFVSSLVRKIAEHRQGFKFHLKRMEVELRVYDNRLRNKRIMILVKLSRFLDAKHFKLKLLLERIEAKNPERVLKSGFALVRDGGGVVISTASNAPLEMFVEFRDNKVQVIRTGSLFTPSLPSPSPSPSASASASPLSSSSPSPSPSSSSDSGSKC